MSATWKTNSRSSRAHLVENRRPVCEAPTPQGGTSWCRTQRGHYRCEDCRAIENGATAQARNDLRNSRMDMNAAAHAALND